MKIFFLHGKNKTIKDPKLVHLSSIAKNKNYECIMLDYSDTKDPNIRAQRLLHTLQNINENIILVGASMGGYASVWASSQIPIFSMFLLAPALYLKGYNSFSLPLKCKNISIVHGWFDDVVSVDTSINFAKQTHSQLHIIQDDHSLNNKLNIIENLFISFLDKKV